MKSIFWGVVLIAIGLYNGDSIFRGEFTLLSVVFDALGIFFIIRGVLAIRAARGGAAATPSTPPPSSRSPQMR